MEVALADNPAFVSQLTLKRKKALKLASRLHVTRIRVNLPWREIVSKAGSKRRPKHRHYDFTSYDRLYNAARRRGIKLQLTIAGPAPRWATGNGKPGNYKVKLADFEHFVRAVIKHFRRHVDRYSIWNEPNFRSWNSPLQGNAERYRKMYRVGWKTIHHYDTRARVLIGETSPYGKKGDSTSPIKFLRAVAKGGKLKADGYAHHPYDYVHGPHWPSPRDANASISQLGNLTDALDELAERHKLTNRHGRPLDLYLTEFGYMRTGRYRKPTSKRANYLRDAFEIALRNPRVREMTQYGLAPPPRYSRHFDMSIVTRKGKPTTVFETLRDWADQQARAHTIALPAPR
jgi:hypothetical protein